MGKKVIVNTEVQGTDGSILYTNRQEWPNLSARELVVVERGLVSAQNNMLDVAESEAKVD